MVKHFNILLLFTLAIFSVVSATPHREPLEWIKKDASSYSFDIGHTDFTISNQQHDTKNFKRLSYLTDAIVPYFSTLLFFNTKISQSFSHKNSHKISDVQAIHLARAPPV